VELVNAVNRNGGRPRAAGKTLGVDRTAPLPQYHARSARQRLRHLGTTQARRGRSRHAQRAGDAATTGGWPCSRAVMATATSRALDEDLVAVFAHNASKSRCSRRSAVVGCRGLELGDLEAVARLKEYNIPQLAQAVDAGYDLVAPIPSCVLMFKQELPLMYPEDAQVRQVAARMFDPFRISDAAP